MREAGRDGLARIMNFIQRCLPDTAPRTAEEEEAARQQDWRTVQAAVSPSLLPELRFHDLVFGAVLGEGAFSVVKYARQIMKVRILFCCCSNGLFSCVQLLFNDKKILLQRRIRRNHPGQSTQ